MNIQMISIIKQLCDQENEQLIKQKSKLRYEVFQLSDLIDNTFISSYFLAKFYNENFCGNEDFMHIPTYGQVLEDTKKYPIIIAREEGSKDFLGSSILKYSDSSQLYDPYYPLKNTKYYSITGILTNEKNQKKGYYGVGKKIYEIALHSVLKYKQFNSDIQVMCVIDCRNKNSIKALNCAAHKINEIYKENIISNEIVGYYTVERDEKLVEAPTFVIKMNLESLDTKTNDTIISYEKNTFDKSEMYLDMLKKIHNTFQKNNEYNYIRSIDPECGIVKYYPLDENLMLQNINIITNGTEFGNDRVPNKLLLIDAKKELLRRINDSITASCSTNSVRLVKKRNYI